MAYKRRPKCIEALIEQVNHDMWNQSLKLDASNTLFWSIHYFLLKNGWYRGFNFFHDEEITLPDGSHKVIKILHGSDRGYQYVQFM